MPSVGDGEGDALFGDLALVREREHLEAAGVGQDGLSQPVKSCRSAVVADDVEARAQKEVKRVAQDDLRRDQR